MLCESLVMVRLRIFMLSIDFKSNRRMLRRSEQLCFPHYNWSARRDKWCCRRVIFHNLIPRSCHYFVRDNICRINPISALTQRNERRRSKERGQKSDRVGRTRLLMPPPIRGACAHLKRRLPVDSVHIPSPSRATPGRCRDRHKQPVP